MPSSEFIIAPSGRRWNVGFLEDTAKREGDRFQGLRAWARKMLKRPRHRATDVPKRKASRPGSRPKRRRKRTKGILDRPLL